MGLWKSSPLIIDSKLIVQKLDELYSSTRVETHTKSDNSPVTNLDLTISNELYSLLNRPSFSWIDEERPRIGVRLPAFIVDPIDGTKEFIRNIPECATSLACIRNDYWASLDNVGLIYNFMAKELFFGNEVSAGVKSFNQKILVSRTEWDNGLLEKLANLLELEVVGSIAYKLALLSAGKCAGVISLRPKNIWDIAAGTVLCSQKGLRFYSGGNEIKNVSEARGMIFEAPLIWGTEQFANDVQKMMH